MNLLPAFIALARITTQRLIFAIVFLSAWTAPRAADYQVGQGLPVGDFLFSGYLNVEALVPQSDVNMITLDDVSLFFAVTGNYRAYLSTPAECARRSGWGLWRSAFSRAAG
jgi:hypothetical protein